MLIPLLLLLMLMLMMGVSTAATSCGSIPDDVWDGIFV